MTDKHDDEFGFDSKDVEDLKRNIEVEELNEEAAELEAELDIDSVDDADEIDNDSFEDDEEEQVSKRDAGKGKNGKSLDAENLEKISKAAREQSMGNDEAPVKKKLSSGLVLGVASVAITAVVAAGGYFYNLPMVLVGGSQGYSDSFQGAPASDGFQGQASFAQEAIAPQPETSGFESGSSDDAFADFGIESGNSNENVPEDFDGLASGFSNDTDVDGGTLDGTASQDQHSFVENDQMVSEVEQQEQMGVSSHMENDGGDGDVVLRPTPLSDEELMYDNILAEANTLDVPHEAIKIDRNVINMELQVKRISRAELDIAETRKALGALSGVIDEIRAQTVEISKAIEKNNERSAAYSEDLKKLSSKVDKQIEQQNADISSLKKELNALAVAPKTAPAKAEPKPAAKVEQKQQVAVAPKPKEVTLPKQTRPVMVKAPTPPRPVSSACDASKVSENWRVKGVTPTSAYVVRTQDGQGLLLRAGVALPGFGTVKSFDPNQRTVCTTSGIVRR